LGKNAGHHWIVCLYFFWSKYTILN